MSVRVTVTSDRFDLQSLVDEALMKEIGDLAVTRIRRRTELGRSSSGAPFRPLSPGYAKRKAAELGHSRPDLTVSGRMLNDMKVTSVDDHSAAITFISSGGPNTGARRALRNAIEGSGRTLTLIQRSRLLGANDKAFYHNEGGRVIREFFDLNDEDDTAITAAVERHLDRTLPE